MADGNTNTNIWVIKDPLQDDKSYDSNSIKKPVLPKATKKIYYDTDHPNIGIALVFNHFEFDPELFNTTEAQKLHRRQGTEKDKDRINLALRSMGFDVRIHDDKTCTEIKNILRKVASEDHSKNDCFVLVAMSHGTPGQIYAHDMTYPVERLWTPFLGKNCKTLRNKPKLFFIQACRGDKMETSVLYKDFGSLSFNDIKVHDAPPQTSLYAIPNSADLLLMYSTFEGKYSLRDKNDGSWFIQSLSHVLEEFVEGKEEQDILHLLTALNRKVAYEYQGYLKTNYGFHEVREMPNFVSTLTKTYKIKSKPKPPISMRDSIDVR